MLYRSYVHSTCTYIYVYVYVLYRGNLYISIECRFTLHTIQYIHLIVESFRWEVQCWADSTCTFPGPWNGLTKPSVRVLLILWHLHQLWDVSWERSMNSAEIHMLTCRYSLVKRGDHFQIQSHNCMCKILPLKLQRVYLEDSNEGTWIYSLSRR